LNLVHVDGTPEAVLAVRQRPDVTILGGQELERGRARVSGYVPTEAFSDIEALGATITVVKDEATLQAQDEQLYALFDEGESPPVA
jgi:hypothetical protein